MSSITQFTFHNDYNIRIIDIDGELWFVASDVASALEYRDASNMVRNLDADEADTHIMSISSESGIEQNRQVTIINESGLYSAILKSRKPEAKKFKKWVTSEVLPAIRKTGKYETPKPIEKRNYINNNDMLNIKRLIWHCAGHLDQEASFGSAVWLSLRKVTGVPSPAKFEIEHLPILAQEFQRILSIIEPYIRARYECEKSLIKHLLRDREDADSLLNKLLEDMKQSVGKFDEMLQQQLPTVFRDECLRLIQRAPCTIDHRQFNHWS